MAAGFRVSWGMMDRNGCARTDGAVLGPSRLKTAKTISDITRNRLMSGCREGRPGATVVSQDFRLLGPNVADSQEDQIS